MGLSVIVSKRKKRKEKESSVKTFWFNFLTLKGELKINSKTKKNNRKFYHMNNFRVFFIKTIERKRDRERER